MLRGQDQVIGEQESNGYHMDHRSNPWNLEGGVVSLSGDPLISVTIVFTSKNSKSLKSPKFGLISLQVSLFYRATL
jgi:hypothetical protein